MTMTMWTLQEGILKFWEIITQNIDITTEAVTKGSDDTDEFEFISEQNQHDVAETTINNTEAEKNTITISSQKAEELKIELQLSGKQRKGLISHLSNLELEQGGYKLKFTNFFYLCRYEICLFQMSLLW